MTDCRGVADSRAETMSKPYRLILFDFFNTLVVIDASRLPTLEVAGERIVTTAGLLHVLLAPRFPGLEPAQVLRGLEEAARTIRERWGPELREVPALERFRHLVATLALPDPEGRLAAELLARHMEALRGSYVLPPEHRRLLETLRGRYRLGIFSNCDHAPTVRRVLAGHGIEDWFDPIVISEAIGYRKPGRNAFRAALELAGGPAAEVLFVGDSLADDIAGAAQVGLDAAWLNRKGEPLPEGLSPAYVLESLEGLEPLLGPPAR